jgi:hypothetical protein
MDSANCTSGSEASLDDCQWQLTNDCLPEEDVEIVCDAPPGSDPPLIQAAVTPSGKPTPSPTASTVAAVSTPVATSTATKATERRGQPASQQASTASDPAAKSAVVDASLLSMTFIVSSAGKGLAKHWMGVDARRPAKQPHILLCSIRVPAGAVARL